MLGRGAQAFVCGACAVIAMLPMTGAFLTGLVLGWILTASYALAAISRAQERMQRKVRYWQAQTASARKKAEQLARLLDAYGVRPQPGSWEEWQ
jgi:hypothetical protein